MDFSIFGMIGSAIAAVGSIYAVVQSKKKIEAETDSVIVGASERAVKIIIGQLAYMEGEVIKLQTMIADYRTQIERFVTSEASLKRRIAILENYILHNGLPVPE